MFSVRNILFIATGVLLVTLSCAQTVQTYNIDSLKKVLTISMHDTNRIWALNNLGRNIQNSDTILQLAEQAISLSKAIGFKKGEVEAYNNIAYWFNQKGNYPKALENYHTAIQLAESVNYEAGLKRSFNSISTVYIYLKDYTTSINYARKARLLSIRQKDLTMLALSSSWLSKSFLELHRNDSALKYAQESYEAAAGRKEALPLYFATSRLGEVHAAERNLPIALAYLRLSLNNSRQDGRYFRIADAHQQLANVFKLLNARDSCLWHARRAFDISLKENLSGTLLSSSLLLSELYEGVNNAEALRYHKLALASQDSLFSQEKNQQVEALRYAEIQRQQEVETLKQQAADRRKNNLQYAAIAFGLVAFIIVFLLLSHTVLANPPLIKFLGILALLIVFEFINLLMGPFIDGVTNHSPFLMLIIMVFVAALLIPVHNRLEALITHKLIEKNKKIRLAAARKIIAKLEMEPKD